VKKTSLFVVLASVLLAVGCGKQEKQLISNEEDIFDKTSIREYVIFDSSVFDNRVLIEETNNNDISQLLSINNIYHVECDCEVNEFYFDCVSYTIESHKYFLHDNYIKNYINIVFPQINNIADVGVQNSINKLLYDNALGLLTSYGENVTGLRLYSSFEIAWLSENFMSIKQRIYFFKQSAAYDNHLLQTLNLDLRTGNLLILDDFIEINMEFIEAFKTNAIIDLDNNHILQKAFDYIIWDNTDEELMRNFKLSDIQNGESMETEYACYFTDSYLGIKIATLHALGSYAEIVIDFDDLKDFMKKDNDIWDEILLANGCNDVSSTSILNKYYCYDEDILLHASNLATMCGINDINREAAELAALEYFKARTHKPFQVEYIEYDAFTDKYIVIVVRATEYFDGSKISHIPIEEYERVNPRVAIVGIKDGIITYFYDAYDTKIEWIGWSVIHEDNIIIVEGPSSQIYEFYSAFYRKNDSEPINVMENNLRHD